jgi:CCR4-NOT transcriptional complex subunit CAF120
MLQTYQPPLMEVAQDTLPELQPIFTFLNSHSNKLYQEGYLFKLNDYDPSKGPKYLNIAYSCLSCMLTIGIDGKPCSDRNWKEYFAQLVGTILSLWDAEALDASSQDGEVVPTFINLTDASTKV